MARKEIGVAWNGDSRNAMNDNFKEVFTGLDNAAQKAIEEIGDEFEAFKAKNDTHFLPPVASVADRDRIYPRPENGDTVRVTGETAYYRYEDGRGWIKTDEYNPTAIDNLSQQLTETERKKADVSYVDAKAQAVSLAWKESYATLADLQAAYPTGDAFNHVVRTDGMIYTYAKGAWTNTQVQANGTGVAPNSVAPDRTTFFEHTRNLFDGEYVGGVMAYNASTQKIRYRALQAGEQGVIALTPIEPGKTYTIKKHDATDRFRLGIVNSRPTLIASFKDADAYLIEDDALNEFTFTNTANGQYLMAMVSFTGQKPRIQVEEGATSTNYTEPYVIGSRHLPVLPKNPVMLGDLEFVRSSKKNLFKEYSLGLMAYSATEGALRYRRNFDQYVGKIAIIPIEANKTYAVKIHEPELSNVFRVAVHNSLPTFTNSYQNANRTIINDDKASEVVFANDANGRYLMVYVANDGKEPALQVEVGDKPTAYEPPVYIPKQYLQPYDTDSKDTPSKSDGNRFGIYFNEMLTAQFVRPDIGFITTTEGGFDLQSTTTQFIYDKFDELMAAHPDYISRRLLGYAGDADRKEDLTRPIYEYYFKAKRPDASDVAVPLLLIDSGIHGYEKQAVWVTYQWFKHICENHESDEVADFMRHNIDFRVIPVASPYSYDKNQRHNATGTDPNTNFAADWYLSGDTPGNGTYSGTEPMTELETLLLDRWFAEFSGKTFGYINMHNTDGVNTTTEGKVGICWVITPDKDTRTLERSIIADYSRKWHREFTALQTVPYGTFFGYVNERTAGTARNQAYKKHGIRSITLDPDRRLSLAFPGTIYNGYEGYAINMDLLGATIVGFVRSFAK